MPHYISQRNMDAAFVDLKSMSFIIFNIWYNLHYIDSVITLFSQKCDMYGIQINRPRSLHYCYPTISFEGNQVIIWEPSNVAWQSPIQTITTVRQLPLTEGTPIADHWDFRPTAHTHTHTHTRVSLTGVYIYIYLRKYLWKL
jgi:hypothetical protein